MNSAEDVWAAVLDLMKKNMTDVSIRTWFSDCEVVGMDEGCLTLLVPNDFKRDVIETRFKDTLKAALCELFSGDFDIRLVSAEEAEAVNANRAALSANGGSEYTFASFVVGPSNEFAHAAALAVAEERDRRYNPLFIYGDSGLGKTHLLYAISHELGRRHPEFNIVFVRANDFLNEFVTAIQTGKTAPFRDKYRSADVFLVDDIQLIAGKASTEEEIFHTFNTLHEAGKQIVFTSDRPPAEINALADRLKSRFEWGLIADIQPPNIETRMAIIRNKCVQLGLILRDDVVTYIAENMTANVRQLEGAVKKLKAHDDMMEGEITVAVAAKTLKDMFREKGDYVITPEDIIEETAKFYRISPDDIKGKSKVQNIATARQVAIYLVRNMTILPLADIGEIFGGRDHTTVMYSIDAVEKKLRKNKDFERTVTEIKTNVNSRGA